MSPQPTVTMPVQFELYADLKRSAHRSFLLSAAFALVALCGTFLAFLSFARPLPVVVASDNPMEPRRIVAAGDRTIREVDAMRFLYGVGKKLHGWSSLDVVAELTDASNLMTARWRMSFLAEVNKELKVPVSVSPSGKTTLLETYVIAQLRNTFTIDWDSVVCARIIDPTLAGTWHCTAEATLLIEPLPSEANPAPAGTLTKRMSIRASFKEVSVTDRTIDGLLVDYWDATVGGVKDKNKADKTASTP